MQQGGISDVMDSCKTIIQVLLANILFPVFYGFPLDLGVCCFFSLLLALNLFLVSHVSTHFIWLCLICDPGHEQIPSTYSLNFGNSGVVLHSGNTLAIGLCRAMFFESRRFGSVFKFNGYLIFLMTSSSSFFEEKLVLVFWKIQNQRTCDCNFFSKFRIKEPPVAGLFEKNQYHRTSPLVLASSKGPKEPVVFTK